MTIKFPTDRGLNTCLFEPDATMHFLDDSVRMKFFAERRDYTDSEVGSYLRIIADALRKGMSLQEIGITSLKMCLLLERFDFILVSPDSVEEVEDLKPGDRIMICSTAIAELVAKCVSNSHLEKDISLIKYCLEKEAVARFGMDYTYDNRALVMARYGLSSPIIDRFDVSVKTKKARLYCMGVIKDQPENAVPLFSLFKSGWPEGVLFPELTFDGIKTFCASILAGGDNEDQEKIYAHLAKFDIRLFDISSIHANLEDKGKVFEESTSKNYFKRGRVSDPVAFRRKLHFFWPEEKWVRFMAICEEIEEALEAVSSFVSECEDGNYQNAAILHQAFHGLPSWEGEKPSCDRLGTSEHCLEVYFKRHNMLMGVDPKPVDGTLSESQ